MVDNIIYFEVNNWFAGRDYPDCEPFLTWMRDLGSPFRNEDWCKEQKICVVYEFIDMSQNFKVTATRDWVERNCPCLLEDKYKSFIHILEDEYDEDETEYFETHRYGNGPFLKYCEENFGVHEYDYDFDCWYNEEHVNDEDEDDEDDEDEK